ncbi:MAG: hypothetical protein PVJ57_22730 [Phycisphaerae bacterium]|jgi:hypothetical protein
MLYQIRNLHTTTRSFRIRLKEVASALQIDPNWLAAVIAFETGYTWWPDVVVGGGRYRGRVDDSRAVGLIQFTNAALSAMSTRGWTTSKFELAHLTAEQQLVWVERYFRSVNAVGRMADVGDVYMAVFAPAFVGQPDTSVVYAKPSAAYGANSGLDTNRDGTITRGEACASVRYLLREGMERGELREVDDDVVGFCSGDDGASSSAAAVVEAVAALRRDVVARLDRLDERLERLRASRTVIPVLAAALEAARDEEGIGSG